MQHHLDQAYHNKKFHDCIEKEFSEQFFDWKITVLFYVSIHWLKALSEKRKVNIGETHYDIEQNVNPLRNNAKMKITQNAWREYKSLFNYSRTSRYEGITDFETFEKLKQIDYSFCLVHLENFKKYIKGQGVIID